MTVHIISASNPAVTKWHCTRRRERLCIVYWL